MDILLEALSRYGLPGAIVAVMLALYVKKDNELKAERDARISDAKAYNELSLKLQSEVITAVHNVALVFEEVKKSSSQHRGGRP